MDELARAMGYKGASSIQRYENPDDYKKRYISPDLAAKLLSAIEGKGEPPIRAADVWALVAPPVQDAKMEMAIRLADLHATLLRQPIEVQNQVVSYADSLLKARQGKTRDTATKQAS